ncbi:hypothetical protein K445DRAFT_323581 [Daldinia sp. EC12]|nr:hypothetical protein K445DRAFT_323581 [Daldinia sp. EC12]
MAVCMSVVCVRAAIHLILGRLELPGPGPGFKCPATIRKVEQRVELNNLGMSERNLLCTTITIKCKLKRKAGGGTVLG